MRKLLFIFLACWSVSALAQPTLQGTDNIWFDGTDTHFKRPLSDLTTFILGNQFTAFTGPTTSVKTFTLPNASATILTSNSPVTVAQGGTGLTTLGTANQQLRVNAGATALEYFTPSGGGSGDITNGGNTTGAAVTIGTNDAFGLNLETNGTTRLAITGAASTGGAATFTETTANTNAVTNSLTVAANSTGTAANNFGTGILFKGESSTTNDRDLGGVSARWATVTDASRKSYISLYAIDAAVSYEAARFGTTQYGMILGGGATEYYDGGINVASTYTISGTSTINLTNTNTGSGIVRLAASGNGASTTSGIKIGDASTFTQTSGTRNYMDFDYSFAPSSGSAVHNQMSFTGTLNQTGGASGITRGINLAHTMTAVADYRAIEIADNHANAKGIYQTGSSTTNRFVGKTTFGATTAPTSLLMLAAGTATANTAPLKFTSGTNLTTPEAGAVEFDGTNYYVTSSTTRYTLAKTLKVSSAIDFASIAANDAAVTSVTVTGATVGNPVILGLENTVVNTGVVFTVWVHGTNTVRIEARNVTGSAVDLVSASYTFSVLMY